MVALTSLWLPILLSAVFVFIASSILHMLLSAWHRGDHAQLPGEDSIRAAMRKEGVSRGDYYFPYAGSMAELKSEETAKKFEQGPVGFLTVLPNGLPAMGSALVQWFVYSVAIAFLTAYVTGRTVGAGAEYLHVFRVAGTVAFLGFAGAAPMASIWRGQKWSTSIKHVIDGWVYSLLVAGTFSWLWPS
jgi:hypothetical protein